MKLNEIQPHPGAKKRRKRLGCGIGSGHGKTAGRGHKGQKSRSGGKIPVGFEGGQMPLIRRLPKRGFTSKRRPFQIVNVSQLERFPEGSVVNPASLRQAGMVRDENLPIKLLGEGELSKKLEVIVSAASKTAKEKVESAGGSIRWVEAK